MPLCTSRVIIVPQLVLHSSQDVPWLILALVCLEAPVYYVIAVLFLHVCLSILPLYVGCSSFSLVTLNRAHIFALGRIC